MSIWGAWWRTFGVHAEQIHGDGVSGILPFGRAEGLEHREPRRVNDMSRSIRDVLAALRRSKFRRQFRLGERDLAYLQTRGMERVLAHARDFVESRLAPARPANDGRQTPMKGHPVFIAQHATATCCRSCLAKWHGIGEGQRLTPGEIDYIIELIETWLRGQNSPNPNPATPQFQLFEASEDEP